MCNSGAESASALGTIRSMQHEVDGTDGGFPKQPHETTSLVRQLLVASAEFRRALADVLSVNDTDLAAMEHLIQRGPSAPTELAAHLGVSSATVTVVVDRLVRAGHVTRRRHATDRRSLVVVPNEQSVAKAVAVIGALATDVDRMLDTFSPADQATISSYLRQVVTITRQHTSDASRSIAHEPMKESTQ